MYPTHISLHYLHRIKMEKRINDTTKQYLSKFKDDIRNKVVELGMKENEHANELLEYIYEYERLCFDKDDFVKRKRVKNVVPMMNRCNAKRANGEQCTRKRREDCTFCGTHYKGTPHGLINQDGNPDTAESQEAVKLDVFAEEIGGIVYYIDKFRNVYKTDDVLESKVNPSIIAKWEKTGERYTIPEFGLM
jgi:hypothetical protein